MYEALRMDSKNPSSKGWGGVSIAGIIPQELIYLSEAPCVCGEET